MYSSRKNLFYSPNNIYSGKNNIFLEKTFLICHCTGRVQVSAIYKGVAT